MSKKHIATFALVAASGRRMGTGYVYRFEEIGAAASRPGFRWRNDDCRFAYTNWRLGGHLTTAQPSGEAP